MATALARDGSVEVFAPHAAASELRAAILEALTTPIDVGYLQFFPKFERTERRADGMVAVLVVQEQV
jgi:hypothetical protein